LVAVVRGANAPLIIKTITDELEKENKVIKGEAERKPVSIFFIKTIRIISPNPNPKFLDF
jgi:hypothetical protein